MARSISTDLSNEFSADTLRPYYACKVTFPNTQGSGDVVHKMWTGNYPLTVGSDTFDGLGEFISISDVSETSDMSASGLSISLIANPTFLTVLRDKQYQGKTVEAFVGALNDDNTSAGQFKFFEGFADQLLFSMQPEACIVTLKAENKLIRLSKSSGRYYTHEDQITEYPNDQGLEFVNAIQDQEVLWGRS